MSDILITIILQIAPIIAAISIIIQNYRAGKKLNHITILTNSTLTAANKRIADLEEIVRKLVAEKNGLRKKPHR